MSESLARLLVWGLTIYLGAGALFAICFAARLAGRLDPAARQGSAGFRLLVIPGATFLWPFLALRLLRPR